MALHNILLIITMIQTHSEVGQAKHEEEEGRGVEGFVVIVEQRDGERRPLELCKRSSNLGRAQEQDSREP